MGLNENHGRRGTYHVIAAYQNGNQTVSSIPGNDGYSQLVFYKIEMQQIDKTSHFQKNKS